MIRTISRTVSCRNQTRSLLISKLLNITGPEYNISMNHASITYSSSRRNELLDMFPHSGTVRTLAGVATVTEEPPKKRRTDLSDGDFEVMLRSGNIQLFDVRDVREIKISGRIPTAANIPLTNLKVALALTAEEFEDMYDVPKPKKGDTNIVYYGRGTVKSLAALEISHKLGFSKSRHYPGGWAAYAQNHHIRPVASET